MPFRFVRRDGVQSKLLTKKSAAAYGTPFKGKRLRLRAARRSHTVATACLQASTGQCQAPNRWPGVCGSLGASEA